MRKITWQRGNHQFKGGFLVALEQKNELSASLTQGSFNFAAGGGFTAFQNFLRGNATGACGTGCTYNEPEREIAAQFRWQRYEFYVQDSWRVNQKLRLDLGLRFSLQPGFTDKNDLLTNFVPGLYDRSQAPQFDATAGRLIAGTGDLLNGIVQVSLETGVPVLSAVLTPQQFHEHSTHIAFFSEHMKTKGKELAEACAGIIKELAAVSS